MTANVHHLTAKKNVGKAEGLLHSLVPRAQCFCFYDNERACVWSSDGAEDFEIDNFVGDLPDEVITALGEGNDILRRTLGSGRTVLALPVHGEARERLGIMVALSRRTPASPHGSIPVFSRTSSNRRSMS